MAPSVGRRFADARQRLKGHQPLRFQLQLIPYFADGLPSHIKKASLLWQRGPKLQFTDLVEVSAAEGIVHWDQTLKQTSTMYRDGTSFAQKEYSFKLQGVKREGKDEKPVTFAKTQIDLANYCSCESSGTRDLIVELRPSGRLHVGVVATWLKNSTPEQDSLTDLSYLSLGPSGPSSTMTGDQDLRGFEDTAAHKASQLSPQKRVAFSHSLSMPIPRRTPAAAPAADARELRSVQSMMPSHHSDVILGTPVLQRTSMPTVQVDTPTSFGGFQTISLEENELVTPTIPRKVRKDLRGSLHRKSKSEPATSEALAAVSLPEGEPWSPTAAPTPSGSVDLHEAYSTLVSSESEDEVGAVASVRKWWTGSKKPSRPSPSPFKDAAEADASEAELEAISRETDVEALRARCRTVVKERDAARRERTQLQRKIRRLERDIEALDVAKRGMQERLAVSEDRLMRLTRSDTVTSLVQTKLRLAQTDYANLELQGQLNQERMRTQALRSRLTHMENEFHATLDRISSSNLIPAHRAGGGRSASGNLAFFEDGVGPVTMPCLAFGRGGSRARQLPARAARDGVHGQPEAISPSLPAASAADAAGHAEATDRPAAAGSHRSLQEEPGEEVQLPVSTAVCAA